MKKLIMIACAGLLAVASMTSCGHKTTETSTANDTITVDTLAVDSCSCSLDSTLVNE